MVKLTWWVPLMKLDLLTISEYTPVFIMIRVTQSSLLCCVWWTTFLFCPVSFGHYIVCPSYIYIFWLSLLQTVLTRNEIALVVLNNNHSLSICTMTMSIVDENPRSKFWNFVIFEDLKVRIYIQYTYMYIVGKYKIYLYEL